MLNLDGKTCGPSQMPVLRAIFIYSVFSDALINARLYNVDCVVVNNELEKMYYPSICIQGLRKL
jgi:hypothetical protein